LDIVVYLTQAAVGISDISDVRVKFQQYDNYQAAIDGREFDNIKIKFIM